MNPKRRAAYHRHIARWRAMARDLTRHEIYTLRQALDLARLNVSQWYPFYQDKPDHWLVYTARVDIAGRPALIELLPNTRTSGLTRQKRDVLGYKTAYAQENNLPLLMLEQASVTQEWAVIEQWLLTAYTVADRRMHKEA